MNAIAGETVERRVIRVIARVLEEEDGRLLPETNLAEDLGVDSFDAISIRIALEEEFGELSLEISDKARKGFRTVRDVINLVRGCYAGQSADSATEMEGKLMAAIAAEQRRIIEVIATALDVEKERVVATARFAGDLRASKLDMLVVFQDLEQKFGLEILDEAADSFLTVGDVIKLVSEHVRQTA